MEENTQVPQILTLDQRIAQDVTRFDVIVKLDEIKAEYAGLTINGIDDILGYTKVNDARKKVVKLRTGTEKVRKDLNADALEYQRRINEHAAKIQEKIAEIEGPLEEKKNKIDNLIKEEQERKAKIVEDRRLSRAKQLAEFGMLFDGVQYQGHGLQVDMASVREMNDSDWATLIEQVATSYKAEQREKEERELIRKQEEERQQKEREALDARRIELERMEAEAAERANKLAEEAAKARQLQEEEIRREQEARAEVRRDILADLGVSTYQTGPHAYFVLDEDEERIPLMEANNENLHAKILVQNGPEWSDTITKLKQLIQSRREQMKREKAEAEEERERQLQEAKKAAADAERRRIEKEHEERAKAQAEEEARKKREADEEAARIKREEELRPDREKLVKFAEEVLVLELPEVGSEAAKIVLKQFETAIITAAANLKEAAKKL